MGLTDADVKSLVAEMKAQGFHQVCRYDIDPADMRHLMEFVRTFYDGAIETRKTFRTMLIRMVVWGAIAGFIGLLANRFGWLKPIGRLLAGGPQ
jgi:hypothetical protein